MILMNACPETPPLKSSQVIGKKGALKWLSFIWVLIAPYALATSPIYMVAQDGTGNFKTIQGAIDATKAFPSERIIIKVKKGVYKEKIVVHEWNTLLTLEGEDRSNTIVRFDDHFNGIARGRNSTFFTPTMQVNADDFIGKNFTIVNGAGDVGQAIALAVNANRVLMREVTLLGNQDTLYVTGEGNKMLFSDCYIEGTTDFIFGSASVVFDRCTLHAKSNSFITAASTGKNASFGLVFLRSTLTAAPGVKGVYLGRPWRPYAQTVFIESELGAHISPKGWDDWQKPETHTTAFYREFANRGPGAALKKRVKWSKQLTKNEAAGYSLDVLLEDKHHPAWYSRQ